RLAQQRVQVEVAGLRPSADAHLDPLDAPLGAPAERLQPVQVSQAVVEQSDPQSRSLGGEPPVETFQAIAYLLPLPPPCQGGIRILARSVMVEAVVMGRLSVDLYPMQLE